MDAGMLLAVIGVDDNNVLDLASEESTTKGDEGIIGVHTPCRTNGTVTGQGIGDGISMVNMDGQTNENQNMYQQPPQQPYPVYVQQLPPGTNMQFYQASGYPQGQQPPPSPYGNYPANAQYPPPYTQGQTGHPQFQGGYTTTYYNQAQPTPQGYGNPYQQRQQGFQGQQTQYSTNYGTGGQAGTSTDPARTFWGYVNYTQIQFTPSFEDPKVRQAFIRKVYIILTLQLLFCSGVIFFCIYTEEVRNYLRQKPGVMLFFLLTYLVVNLSTSCCCFQLFVTHPCDFFLLILETMLLSGFAAATACMYSPWAVLMAAGTTALLTFVLTLFAFQTKIDLTGYAGAMCVAIVGVLVVSIVGGVLFPWLLGIRIPYLHLIITCVMVAIICVLIIMHTQMLMRDKELSLEPTMYCLGANMLFYDIVLLFVYLLSLFGGASND